MAACAAPACKPDGLLILLYGMRYRFSLAHPSGWAEERRQKRIRASDSLSRRRVRARPSFYRAPQVGVFGSDTHFDAVHGTATEGRAEGSANWGSDPKKLPDPRVAFPPFLYLGFFGADKGIKSPTGARPGLWEVQPLLKPAAKYIADQVPDDSLNDGSP